LDHHEQQIGVGNGGDARPVQPIILTPEHTNSEIPSVREIAPAKNGNYKPPMHNLFDETKAPLTQEKLAEEAWLFRGLACDCAAAMVRHIQELSRSAPFRRMVVPGGRRMSVAVLNCGSVGWTSDRRGYRYTVTDPETGMPWPAMPPLFTQIAELAAAKAGFPNFRPDCCLVNRYEPGAKLSLHQDKDEGAYDQPIVSVSLGLPANFRFGGRTQKEGLRRFYVENGDVAVWGGPSRLAYHGVDALSEGEHPLTGRSRFNLTFRAVDMRTGFEQPGQLFLNR
jgi:alkylated DNA repair protein (DNA oxidative demethylase)